MEKFVIAAGVATRYCDLGVGEHPILLIHGYLESIEIWDGFIGGLGKSNRVLAVDVPGHGVSQVVGEVHTMEFCADVMADVLGKASIEKAVIVGHSMGGYIAQAFCKKYPQMTAGLVILHSSPNGDTEEKRKNREREIEVIRSGKKELLSVTASGKGFAKENRKRFSEEISEIADQIMFTDDDGIVALLEGMMRREDMNKMLDDMTMPLMFCFGHHDEYIPIEAAEAMAERHPKARVEWFTQSGHMSFLEEKERCVEVINDFVSECFK